jgi:hypothetical protein
VHQRSGYKAVRLSVSPLESVDGPAALMSNYER